MNAPRLIRKLAIAVLLFAPLQALAAPKVVTSIRPVQALVYAVTGEANLPDVVLDPGTSPHAFALKPSQAQMLQDADIVFWVGPSLETALEGPLKSLSANARHVALIDTPGLDLLHLDADGDGPGGDGPGGDGPGGDGHGGHGHGAIDPHVWLSPNNAMILIDAVRDALTALAPDHASVYAKNAKVAKNRLKLLHKKMREFLSHSNTVPYMVQHDGFGYVARDFGMNQVGHLQTVPGREPGAKHVSQVRQAIAEKGVKCLFTEPQFTPALAQRLEEETGVRLGELDPMGATLDLSPTLHVRLIQHVVLRMDECLYTKPIIDTPAQQ